MTSEHLAQLCCLVVEDLYGSFLAHIFGQLAYHGRLLSQHLAQRCRLPLRQIKAGLATLTQLRLVHHFEVDGYSAYHANLPRAYDLLRTGKLSNLTHKHHGTTAVKVVQRLASVGFSTTSDLIIAVEEEMRPEEEEMDENAATIRRRKITNAINSLAEDEFFSRVYPAHLQIVHDARGDADGEVTAHPPEGWDFKLKGKKQVEQQVQFVNAEMGRRLDTYLAPQLLKADAEAVMANGGADDEPGQDVIYICINYSRTVKSTRGQVFSQHVTKAFGEAHAKVGGAVLNQVDLTPPYTISNAAQGDEPRFLSLSRLISDLEKPASHYLQNGSPHTNGWHHDEKMTNGVAEEDDVDHDEVQQRLASLAEGPYRLLEEAGDAWKLHPAKFRKFMLRQEIMKIARQQVGIIGVRLIRMLIDKGRLDEKILQEMGLLSAREMRSTLAKLHRNGFIELQEVPKDPQRQPNRTIFLWFYDEARVQKALLEDIYKTMARLHQRLQVEREKMKLTLDKVERHGEGDYMQKAEALLLQQFRRKERWLLGEVARLDDSVALLRDL